MSNYTSGALPPPLTYDGILIKGLAAMFNCPSIEIFYANPVNYLSNNAINLTSTVNFAVLSQTSSLASYKINNVINAYPFLKTPLEPLDFFATIGGRSLSNPSGSVPSTLNLFNLTPHTLFLYYTSKKMKNHVSEAFRSLSILFKALSSNNWSHQVHTTLPITNNAGQIGSFPVTFSHKYTWQELSLDIIFQTGFALNWGALAGITYKGMSDAINLTGSIPAQHALTLMTTAIALFHFLPLCNIQKVASPSSFDIIPPHPQASQNKNMKLQFNTYPVQKPKDSTNYFKYSTLEPEKFDPTKYDPYVIGKEREKLLGENKYSPLGGFKDFGDENQ